METARQISTEIEHSISTETDLPVFVQTFQEFIKDRNKFLINSNRTNFNEVIIITKGQCKCWIDVHKYLVNEGTILLYTHGQIQRFEKYENIEGSVILFPQQFLFSNTGENEIIHYLDGIYKLHINPKIKPTTNEFNSIKDVVERIRLESSRKNDLIQSSIVVNIFKILFLKIIQSNNKQNTIPILKGDHLAISELIKLLEENFNYEKNVSFYADHLFMTSKKLNEIVKKYFNKTTKQLIEERIILETKRHLIHSDISIKEISYLVGFSDPTNFNKFFKKNTDKTPAEFRESFL